MKNELKKEFNKTDLDEGWLDKTSVDGKWRITIDGVYLDIPAGKQDSQSSGKVTIKVGNTNLKEVADITTLYGSTTDFTSVDGVEWQLFYDDDDWIYLIASDYVPGNTLPSELIEDGQDGQYTTYCRAFATYDGNAYVGTIMENAPWSNGTESSTITGNTQTNTYLKWVNSSLVTIKNNPNMKAVAYMMDTSKWSNFAGSVNGAYAIGGPTLEMFVLSYNSKHSTNQLGTYGTSVSHITSDNADSEGYKVKIGTGEWETCVSGLDASSDNMWVKTSNEKAYGYWIASPMVFDDGVHFMNPYGNLSYYIGISYGSCGFRPLVSIPKSSLKN